MKRPPRIILYCGALLVVCAVLALLGGAARNRGSLQSYRAELRARGEKLTFQELELSRSTNGNGSMAALSNAVAKLGIPQFPPGNIDVRKYVRPGSARLCWRGASPGWTSTTSSNAQPTWAELAEQITAAQSALAQLREALRDPRASSGPCTNLMAGPPSNFVAIRTAAQWLMNAALYESRQGGVEQALQDVESLASLAQWDRGECTLVAQAIRVAVTSLGLATCWEILNVPGWTDPQLARLQAAWEAVHPVEAIEFAFVGYRAFTGELDKLARKTSFRQTGRFTGVTMFPQGSVQGLLADYVWFPIYRLTSINADALFHLKAAEETITGLRMVEAHRPWKEAKQHLDQPGVWISQVDRFPTKFRYWVSLTSFPNTQRVTSNAVRAETERELTLAAIALKRYQLRHGSLPASLNSVVPEFLSALPYDPMSGKALCYRPGLNGGYVLYSVGEDGTDDGGDSKPTSGKAAGLWEGRDVVWPTALEQEP
jgi:hypothetical protein